MKKYLLIPVISLLIGLSFAGEVFAVSGFIPKQIWYSKENLIEGDTVDVYTSVWNGEEDSILVKVDFYDYDVLLGSREIIVKPQELKEVSVKWKITAGEHLISAKIVSSVVIIGEDKKNVSLRYIKTTSDKQEIEKLKVKTNEENKEEKTLTDSFFVDDILPENVSATINESYTNVDNFRAKTSSKLLEEKEKAKEQVESLKDDNLTKDLLSSKKSAEDITKKPFAYVKLFILSVLSFIFENKIVFYGLIVLVTFYFIRLIFRSFKHK
jgi:hypothetical protein